ncbi:MAG: hypothetical protein U0930_24350 [Pirellulales bacterium]
MNESNGLHLQANRGRAVLGIVFWTVIAWWAMCWTHELGHVLSGWCFGATLISLDLWPWHLPYSFYDPDPHPLVTTWGGPILGCLIPIVLSLLVRRAEVRYIASFCVLANGLYIASAALTDDRLLDTAKLLEHGANWWQIVLFCAFTVTPGYFWYRRELLQQWHQRNRLEKSKLDQAKRGL